MLTAPLNLLAAGLHPLCALPAQDFFLFKLCSVTSHQYLHISFLSDAAAGQYSHAFIPFIGQLEQACDYCIPSFLQLDPFKREHKDIFFLSWRDNSVLNTRFY